MTQPVVTQAGPRMAYDRPYVYINVSSALAAIKPAEEAK